MSADIGEIISWIGLACGAASLVWIAFEAVRMELLERPRPSQPSDEAASLSDQPNVRER